MDDKKIELHDIDFARYYLSNSQRIRRGGGRMREILFRGKRVDNGEWVEGYYAKYRNISDKVYTAILQFDAEDGGDVYCDGITPVIPETVGQYTGLTDKNGKRIFEGDIVRGDDYLGDRREGFVFYANYNAMYMINPHTKSEYREENRFTSLTPAEKYLEIIGNIHDNPELLEDEQ